MTTQVRPRVVSVVLFLAVAFIGTFSIPFTSGAATYAYVATSGEVRTVEANNWIEALAKAIDCSVRSGVMELMRANDPVVGDRVDGVAR